MSRLLALSGETVKVKGRDGKEALFTVTAFDPVADRYIGMGHKATVTEDPIGKVPVPVLTTHFDGIDGLCALPVANPAPHPFLGPIVAHNNFGVCGRLIRPPRQGLMWTAKARVGQAYVISNAFADLLALSVDALPVAIPIEINDITYQRHAYGGTKFSFKGAGGCHKGMSGSPIIQDGYIVGAIYGHETADKTVGIAVHIDQMLDALYREENAKVKVTGHVSGTHGSGKRHIRATRRRAKKNIQQVNTLAAGLRRVQGNLFYLKRLIADTPKFQALQSQLAAYEAGSISKGILFEKQKRTYPEALKLLWDYEQVKWEAALKTWEDRGDITREQRIAIERCIHFDV